MRVRQARTLCKRRGDSDRPARVDLVGAVGNGQQRATNNTRQRRRSPVPLMRTGDGCGSSIREINLGHSCGFFVDSIPIRSSSATVLVGSSCTNTLKRMVCRERQRAARLSGTAPLAIGRSQVIRANNSPYGRRQKSPAENVRRMQFPLLPPNVVSGCRTLKFKPIREFVSAPAASRVGRQDMPPADFF